MTVPNDDKLICTACGTQFDLPHDGAERACRICDDPRQFVPPEGQSWTSLASLKHSGYKNKRQADAVDPRMTSIWTEPKFGIGQRCIFLETGSPNSPKSDQSGQTTDNKFNVLWDCITLLDTETIEWINSRGGLHAIVISHPHYYTTHLHWAEVFDCPVYLAVEDQEWLEQDDAQGRRVFLTERDSKIGDSDVHAITVGGHFPGSLVLLWDRKLFIADTLVTVPSALYHINRPAGTTSYAFMWSIPNMIPLPPATLHQMWQALKPLDFISTHGAFLRLDVRDENVKKRVLESMKIQARGEGWGESECEILREADL